MSGKKFTHKYVKSFFKKEGCVLLSKKYIRNKDKLDYICSCGNQSITSFASFKKGHRCSRCCGGKVKRWKYEEVKSVFEDRKCQLLSKEYKNERTKLDYICSCGNISKIILHVFLDGVRCFNCSGTPRNTQEQIEEIFARYGCKLISRYENNSLKLKYICSCGLENEKTLSNFRANHRCSECVWLNRTNLCDWNENTSINDKERKCKYLCRNMKHRFIDLTEYKDYDIKLDYSPEDLMKHIEGHSNWNKCIGKRWHLDHIFPVKAFCDINILDFQVMNSLDNLQPLPEEENRQKRDLYNKEEFKKYLKIKGLI